MASVDPYVVNIPQWVIKTGDQELIGWYQYDNRWKHDMWQVVVGPTNDISELEGKILSVENLAYQAYAVASTSASIAYYSVSSAHSTTGNEFVRVTASATITLNATPVDGEEVHVQPSADVLVTVSGNINDQNQIIIHRAYDVAHFKYIADAGEWVIQ